MVTNPTETFLAQQREAEAYLASQQAALVQTRSQLASATPMSQIQARTYQAQLQAAYQQIPQQLQLQTQPTQTQTYQPQQKIPYPGGAKPGSQFISPEEQKWNEMSVEEQIRILDPTRGMSRESRQLQEAVTKRYYDVQPVSYGITPPLAKTDVYGQGISIAPSKYQIPTTAEAAGFPTGKLPYTPLSFKLPDISNNPFGVIQRTEVKIPIPNIPTTDMGPYGGISGTRAEAGMETGRSIQALGYLGQGVLQGFKDVGEFAVGFGARGTRAVGEVISNIRVTPITGMAVSEVSEATGQIIDITKQTYPKVDVWKTIAQPVSELKKEAEKKAETGLKTTVTGLKLGSYVGLGISKGVGDVAIPVGKGMLKGVEFGYYAGQGMAKGIYGLGAKGFAIGKEFGVPFATGLGLGIKEAGLPILKGGEKAISFGIKAGGEVGVPFLTGVGLGVKKAGKVAFDVGVPLVTGISKGIKEVGVPFVTGISKGIGETLLFPVSPLIKPIEKGVGFVVEETGKLKGIKEIKEATTTIKATYNWWEAKTPREKYGFMFEGEQPKDVFGQPISYKPSKITPWKVTADISQTALFALPNLGGKIGEALAPKYTYKATYREYNPFLVPTRSSLPLMNIEKFETPKPAAKFIGELAGGMATFNVFGNVPVFFMGAATALGPKEPYRTTETRIAAGIATGITLPFAIKPIVKGVSYPFALKKETIPTYIKRGITEFAKPQGENVLFPAQIIKKGISGETITSFTKMAGVGEEITEGTANIFYRPFQKWLKMAPTYGGSTRGYAYQAGDMWKLVSAPEARKGYAKVISYFEKIGKTTEEAKSLIKETKAIDELSMFGGKAKVTITDKGIYINAQGDIAKVKIPQIAKGTSKFGEFAYLSGGTKGLRFTKAEMAGREVLVIPNLKGGDLGLGEKTTYKFGVRTTDLWKPVGKQITLSKQISKLTKIGRIQKGEFEIGQYAQDSFGKNIIPKGKLVSGGARVTTISQPQKIIEIINTEAGRYSFTTPKISYEKPLPIRMIKDIIQPKGLATGFEKGGAKIKISPEKATQIFKDLKSIYGTQQRAGSAATEVFLKLAKTSRTVKPSVTGLAVEKAGTSIFPTIVGGTGATGLFTGLGQYEKTQGVSMGLIPSQIIKGKMGAAFIQLEKVNQFQLKSQLDIQKEFQLKTTQPEMKLRDMLMQMPEVKLTQKEIQLTSNLQIQQPAQEIVQKTTPITPLIQVPRTPQIPIPETPLKPTFIIPPFLESSNKRKLLFQRKAKPTAIGYEVLVRRRGKFIPSGVSLPRGEALELGIRKTLSTAAATFQIKPTGKAIKPLGIGVPSAQQMALFRSPKKYKPDMFVQLKTKRIMSPGEKREISYAGARARRKIKFFR